MMETKRCTRCEQVKSVDEFGRDNRWNGSRQSRCHKCRSELSIEYRKTKKGKRTYKRWLHSENGQAYRARTVARHKARYPEKVKARTKIRGLVRNGTLPPISTLPCRECEKSARYYHHEDYSKPLEVIPLCQKCHLDVHSGAILLSSSDPFIFPEMDIMKQKPIIFNADMVRAVLVGRKTQTRRPIKPQPLASARHTYGGDRWRFVVPATFAQESSIPIYDKEIIPPWCKGDILYVRETCLELDQHHRPPRFEYRADIIDPEQEKTRKELGYRWKPNIHMPREAARLFLRVKRVWVERVQDIDEPGAQREGWFYQGHNLHHVYDPVTMDTARRWFARLWDSIYAARGYGWDANPWVWACEFSVVDQ